MRLKIFPWLGQEFVSLSWEGSGNGTVDNETRELMTSFADHLTKLGLSLDDVHAAQCLNYLKATGLKVCLLVNFGKPRAEVRRIVLDY